MTTNEAMQRIVERKRPSGALGAAVHRRLLVMIPRDDAGVATPSGIGRSSLRLGHSSHHPEGMDHAWQYTEQSQYDIYPEMKSQSDGQENRQWGEDKTQDDAY